MDDMDDSELRELFEELRGPEPTIVDVVGDSCKALIVGLNEMAITNSEDVVSILATYDLKPSHVAFLGYESDEKIAFLGHFDAGTDIESSVNRLCLPLSYLKQPEGRKHTYSVDIIGDDDVSKRVKEVIEYISRYEHALGMELNEEQQYETDAVSIEVINGDIDPKPPPEYRSLVQERTYKPDTSAIIVYRP